MREITAQKGYVPVEHFVFDVGYEGVLLNFIQQIDDILIISKDADVLVAWDAEPVSPDNGLLILQSDKLKELPNVRCTKFSVMTANPHEVSKVYLTIQRN